MFILEVWLQMKDSWKHLGRDIREGFSFVYSQVVTALNMFKYFARKRVSRDGAAEYVTSWIKAYIKC